MRLNNNYTYLGIFFFFIFILTAHTDAHYHYYYNGIFARIKFQVRIELIFDEIIKFFNTI